ncbi:MAG: cytochrome c [Xanthomonadales bacterium]|nr:cytochrome c [Xanthomonadales bacterium]
MGSWITKIAVIVFALIWLTAAWIYVSSMRMIDRQYVPVSRNLSSVSDPRRLAEGERLANIFGCADACHGDRMQGAVIYEHPLNGRLVAPNLTRAVRERTLPELEAIVRQGINPDGTSVFGMPSSSYAVMTDDDLSAILGYIRQYPLQPSAPGESDYGLLTRWKIVNGELAVQAENNIHQPWRNTFRNNETRLGEYLALLACSDCHGADLEGIPGLAPSLDRIHDYDEFEFVDLLQRGMAPGERPLALKQEVAQRRFSLLTEDEMDALFVFLKTRP